MSDVRELPASIASEKAVLGALLIENAGYDQIARRLDPAHFFRSVHRQIYQTSIDLLDQGRPLDLRTLCEALKDRGILEDIGGPAYVASLIDGVPLSTNVKYYAEIVREKAMLRRLIVLGGTVIDGATANDAESHQIILRTDAALTALATAAEVGAGAVPLASDIPALIADLDYRVQHRGQISGLPTGFPEVDLLTHGWQKRQMVVIAGQTSYGKSVLALNFAHAIAAAGHRVVYYSYEMERKELEWRLVSSLAEIPLTRILWGNLTPAEYAKLAHALETMHALPLEINDGSSRSIVDVRAECRQVKAARGLAAVFLDHFQLMDGVDGENRTQQLSGVSRRIQALGVELDLTTFTLSQLTLSDKDATREPQLDDLRECKSLGHDANAVLMLHPYKPSEARSETAVVPFKLLCRKQRGGRLGRIPLHLERDYVRFVPGEEPAPVPKAKPTGKAQKSWDDKD